MPKFIRPRQTPVLKRDLTDKSWKILHHIDAILIEFDQRDALSYRAIRRQLNRVPRSRRGLNLTDRVVELYCANRMKIKRSSALKMSIRNSMLGLNQMAEFGVFADRLRKTIAPMVLTNHGLLLPFAQRDQAVIADDLTSLFYC
jgi:hypothetical protein